MPRARARRAAVTRDDRYLIELDAERLQRGPCGFASATRRDRPRDLGMSQICKWFSRAGKWLDLGRQPNVRQRVEPLQPLDPVRINLEPRLA
jgi:hypothetical protein